MTYALIYSSVSNGLSRGQTKVCNATYTCRCTIISLKNAETNFSMLEYYTVPLIIYDVSCLEFNSLSAKSCNPLVRYDCENAGVMTPQCVGLNWYKESGEPVFL